MFFFCVLFFSSNQESKVIDPLGWLVLSDRRQLILIDPPLCDSCRVYLCVNRRATICGVLGIRLFIKCFWLYWHFCCFYMEHLTSACYPWPIKMNSHWECPTLKGSSSSLQVWHCCERECPNNSFGPVERDFLLVAFKEGLCSFKSEFDYNKASDCNHFVGWDSTYF